jgi:hypothetical protein
MENNQNFYKLIVYSLYATNLLLPYCILCCILNYKLLFSREYFIDLLRKKMKMTIYIMTFLTVIKKHIANNTLFKKLE